MPSSVPTAERKKLCCPLLLFTLQLKKDSPILALRRRSVPSPLLSCPVLFCSSSPASQILDFLPYLSTVAAVVPSNNAAAVDLSSLMAYPYGARQGSLRQSECPPACSRRCSKTSKHKACMFFCVKCCSKCLCVPPGTYGNKQVCPCYNDWKTQQGGPKCP